MNKKYLSLLAKELPAIDSAVSEIVNLSAIRAKYGEPIEFNVILSRVKRTII